MIKKTVRLCMAAFLAAAPIYALDNSPGRYMVIPEAIWAAATGGGTWTTYLQVTSFTDDTDIDVFFLYGGGGYRGPFRLFDDLDRYHCRAWVNILSALDALDTSGFTYSGRVGALLFRTQDDAHPIHVTARTINGNYGKTFQGLTRSASNYAVATPTARNMMIQNMVNNATYRTFAGFYNDSESSITVEFRVVSWNNVLLGSLFTKTFVGWDFQSFNPFTEAGVPYPAYSIENAVLWIYPQSGSGQLMGFASSANNITNDTYAHLMVHFE